MKNSALTRRSIWRTARAVWDAEAASVTRLAQTIDPESLARCVEVLANRKGRVFATGCGTSGAAARKIAHSLCCIECPAAFLAPGDALHGGLGLVQTGDVVIVISKGGNSREIADMIPSLKAKRALIIGVTESADSAVGKAADVLLQVKVEREPDDFNLLATASTMAVVAVFDAICVALMKQTRYSRDQFAIIHPGGAVGQRLLVSRTQEAHAG
ncbi:MAG TPA: SIS domain-containing protein [Verrucomicrobiae bacterium]|nr:SIS domain-containing protein [Verrucomicrobiae bacterium]